MRGRRKGEKTEAYEEVRVTLADGRRVEIMTGSGVMVMEDEGVEPIVPMATPSTGPKEG